MTAPSPDRAPDEPDYACVQCGRSADNNGVSTCIDCNAPLCSACAAVNGAPVCPMCANEGETPSGKATRTPSALSADEIERKCAEIEHTLADYHRTRFGIYANDMAANLAWALATLRETRRELAATEESNEAMTRKIQSLSPHETCACSYDKPGDVCSHHAPQLRQAIEELAAMTKDRDEWRDVYEANHG